MKDKDLTGTVVHSWREFGHHFQIEKLLEPKLVGAGERYYRLWDNGYPATGGQWHYTFENAVDRAEYCLDGEYINRISYLEQRVQTLEGQLFKAET
jgi:hypothetical protein